MKTYSEKEIETLMNEIGYLHDQNNRLIKENRELTEQLRLHVVTCCTELKDKR